MTVFFSPGLIDTTHTSLNAPGGGAEITSDHVSLLRLVYAEWISVLFCVFPFCWGSVHSLCAHPWRPDKNCSSSSVHVNQGGGRGGERYNEIMKCVGLFFFSKTDRWDAIFLDTTKRLPAVSSLSG